MGAWKSRHAEPYHSRAGSGGKRADLGGLYVRSRWEANWARYLNWQIAHGLIRSWTYEPKTFEFEGIKRGNRFYTPDFEVVNLDDSIDYHEVKGWMDPESTTKLKRMARYHPGISIILIDKPRYTVLARQMRPLIPEWEWSQNHSN